MLFALLCLLAISPRAFGTTYSRSESWSGSGFMDGFNYPAEKYDNTTNGDVFWATPANNSLIYVNQQERVILKVDNTTSVPYNEKRYAPKLYSKSLYEIGTVWVFDAVHLPYGCSVWPAFWTHGANWPSGGEIDIIEGINGQLKNQVALHADGVCTATSKAQTGNTTLTDCNVKANYGSGCTVVAPDDANSYGAGFAGANGGVYVTEFAADGIRVWFYTRSAVPSSLSVSSTSIDTSTLGTPLAEYLSSSCDIKSQFSAQQLILDITLCGDWAGVPALIAQTCPALTGDKTCYTQYVIDDASATYANAYFEINYINVYSTSNATSASGTSSGTAKSSSATTTISAGPGSSSSGVAASASSSRSAASGRRFGEIRSVAWSTAPILSLVMIVVVGGVFTGVGAGVGHGVGGVA